jgi:hypothetical protein
MARYSDLPAELRLAIMEALIDSGDLRGLASLLSASRSDLLIANSHRASLLARLISNSLDAMAGSFPDTRQAAAPGAMARLGRPYGTPLTVLRDSEHVELISLSCRVQRMAANVREPERSLIVSVAMGLATALRDKQSANSSAKA